MNNIQNPQYTDDQKNNLPEPNGMRPLMLQKRQWQADLIAITEAPQDIAATTPQRTIVAGESRNWQTPILQKDSPTDSTPTHPTEALHGSRPVILTELFCFKLFPEYLGTDVAASDLIERLIGGHVQEVGLSRLTDSRGTQWPVLIMRRVPGKNLKECCCTLVQEGDKRLLKPSESASIKPLKCICSNKIDQNNFALVHSGSVDPPTKTAKTTTSCSRCAKTSP